MTDIVNALYSAVERIGFILTVKPNPSELREKDALVKKLLRSLIPIDILRLCPFKKDSIYLLILMQIIGRNAITSTVESPDEFLTMLLDVVRSPEETLKPTRLQVLKIVAILILRFIRPNSILSFINSLHGLSDSDRLYILTEMAVFDGAVKSTDIRDLLASYGSELLPVLLRPETVEVLEKWIDYIPSSSLINSAIFTLSLSLTDCIRLEEVLVKCCVRTELREQLVAPSLMLLHSDSTDHQLLSLRMFAVLFKGVPLPTPLIPRMVFLLNGLPNPDISIHESVLSVLEESSIMTPEVFDLLVVLTAYPKDIEIKLPCKHRKDYINRQQVNEDDRNDVLRYKFFELREDARQCLRRSKLEFSHDYVLEKLQKLTSQEWQEIESLIHAIGAIGPRFDSPIFATQVSQIFLSFATRKNCRPIITSTVLGFLSFSKLYDFNFFNNFVVPFIIESLANIDTIDFDSGWFDFRSKQDNCAVGFLHFISADTFSGRIDGNKFNRLIVNHIDRIKARVFHRDPFRQTRDIFVKSISAIIVKNSTSPCELLIENWRLICEDAADIANFMIPATGFKEELWPVISPTLSRPLLLSRGGEVLVTMYAHKIDQQDLMRILTDGLQTDLVRWLGVIPKLCFVHQSIIQSVSPLLLNCPFNQIPSDWFKCLIRFGEKEMNVLWLRKILASSIASDQVPAVSEFISCLAEIVQETRQVGIQSLVKLATNFPAHNEPIDELIRVFRFDKLVFAPIPPRISEEEYRQFLSGLDSGDKRKIRRFLKKFPNGITTIQ